MGWFLSFMEGKDCVSYSYHCVRVKKKKNLLFLIFVCFDLVEFCV